MIFVRRSCPGLRIKEIKEVYEGEVTELTPIETENFVRELCTCLCSVEEELFWHRIEGVYFLLAGRSLRENSESCHCRAQDYAWNEAVEARSDDL